MEASKAKEILRSLADGRDPATGQQFPPDSPYQQADTVRALFMALEALERGSGRQREPRAPRQIDPNKPKVGAAWSSEEEQQLRDEFAAHKPFSEIAAAHGRTQGAITARLVKLGLIEDTATHRAGQGNRPNRLPSEASAKEGPTPPAMPTDLTQEEKDNLPF